MSAFRTRQLVLPPVVVTELFAAPRLPAEHADMVRNLRTLDLIDGYWERAGLLRSSVNRGGFKARLGDVLVAQACMDADVPLIVSDKDFRHFTRYGLKLAT
jgi:predicted nucleic acid-binding protein